MLGFLRTFLQPRPAPERHAGRSIAFADLSEMPDPARLPPLDRPGIDAAALSPAQRSWRKQGVAVFPRFLPEALVDAYVARRARLDEPSGWKSPTPYEHVEELRDIALYPPLMRELRALVGEDMMLHLALTAWVSTERDWHQDAYLSPDHVDNWYCAVWVALDDIRADSGPFEYIPGSHRWPLLRSEKVKSFLTEDELNLPDPRTGRTKWEQHAERFMTPAIEAEIAARRGKPVVFLPRKGDVLAWHPRLLHRGSRAARPKAERRSLIAHYSGVNHREDMPGRRQDEAGNWFAVFNIPLH